MSFVGVEQEHDHEDENDEQGDDHADHRGHRHGICERGCGQNQISSNDFPGFFGLTFDHEGDGVAVGAVGVLHVEVVALRVHRVDLLDEEAGDVTILALGVLHDLLGQVLAQELLG